MEHTILTLANSIKDDIISVINNACFNIGNAHFGADIMDEFTIFPNVSLSFSKLENAVTSEGKIFVKHAEFVLQVSESVATYLDKDMSSIYAVSESNRILSILLANCKTFNSNGEIESFLEVIGTNTVCQTSVALITV